MTEKNTLKSSLEIFPFVVQVDENSSGKNINSTNSIIASKDCKIDNLGENLNARFAVKKDGECLEVTIPEGMEEKAFLSENGIKVIQLVSKSGCSKLRIISAKKDVNDTETDNVLKNDPKGESLLNKKLQRSEFEGSGEKEGNKEYKTKKVNEGHGAKSESEKTKGNEVGKKSEIEVEDQQSVINNIKSEDTDIEPAGDSVFHIAEAIIAKTLDFEDKKLRSDEENVSGDDVKNKVRSLIIAANKSIKSMPLSGLSDFLKKKSIAFKRATTKLLAKVCENVFYVIRHDKGIQKCVNDLSGALIDYAENRTNYSEEESISKCKNIITIQENLKKLIGNARHMESVNEVLNTVFVRAAVDKFYKKFGDLSNPNVLHDVKFTLNSLYEKMWDVHEKEKSLAINLDTHLDNLVCGFGFVPSPVDVMLKRLEKDAKTKSVLVILMGLSDEHVLDIKGKRFEKLNTGSFDDRNCAFRAVSIGAGFGPNGYNIVQQKVVRGAQKLLEMWGDLDRGLRMRIATMFIVRADTSGGKGYKIGDVKELLQEYIDYRGQGFISGMSYIECLFAAIGLGQPICVVDAKKGKHQTFFPDGRIEEGIDHDYSTFGKPVYVGFIFEHAEALIPLDNKDSQEMDNKLPVLDEKMSKVKDAISKHISGVIYKATNEQSSLLKIIARDPSMTGESFIEAFLRWENYNYTNLLLAMKILAEVDSKLDADKKAKAYNLEKEISDIAKNKVYIGLFSEGKKELENKLKQFVDIFADKAVELCKEEPLFWDNVSNSILRLW